MRSVRLLGLILLCAGSVAAQDTNVRLLRSLSGPSGKVEGNRFNFDETRTKFAFPQDKSLVVYFEWDAAPGNHVLTGVWKAPDGRAVSLSDDIKLQTTNRELRAFWEFGLNETMSSGVWTLDVRVNGQPAGSHVFEVAVPPPASATAPAVANAAPPTSPAPPVQPTLDEVYRNTLRSMVWVHRLDALQRRIDSASGFVFGKDQIATAFQNVDGAADLEIEFAGGRRVRTSELWNANRIQDWAVIRVDTLNVPALELESTDAAVVGTRLIVLNVEDGQARAIGGVDISGRQDVSGFPGRIQITPALNPASAGGPLLSLFGRVTGIVGASLTPGARFETRTTAIIGSNALGVFSVVSAATPIKLVPAGVPDATKSLRVLLDTGYLTPLVTGHVSFSYGGITSNIPKDVSAPMPRDITEFSRKDPAIWVYSWWQKRDKSGKGTVTVNIYDVQNRVRIKGNGVKASLLERSPSRIAFNFPPTGLERGTYRVDVLWDAQTVWRSFFTILD